MRKLLFIIVLIFSLPLTAYSNTCGVVYNQCVSTCGHAGEETRLCIERCSSELSRCWTQSGN